MHSDDLVTRGRGFLLAAQRADGGWGYRPGGMAFVEPTALSLVALLRTGLGLAGAEGAVGRGVSWLLEGQHEDGGWGVCAIDRESTWATAYATLALSRAAQGSPASAASQTGKAIEAGLRWLLRDLGPCVASDRQILPGEIKPMSPSLIGWPWSEGECFWVFPTAIAIIAGVAAGRGESPRVRQGVDYLANVACEGGGWNFGNPYMLDKALWPAEIETAAALLALQAAGEGSPVIAQGLARLEAMLDQSASPLNLAWGLLALGAYGRRHEAALARLVSAQAADGGWRANPFTTAVALLALNGAI